MRHFENLDFVELHRQNLKSQGRRGSNAVIWSDPKLGLETWKHFNQAILDFHRQAPEPERSLIFPVEYAAESPGLLIEAINKKFFFDLKQPKELSYSSSLLKTTASPPLLAISDTPVLP
jgi:hypothetical protein